MPQVQVAHHIGVERRLQLPLEEEVPVDGAEEGVAHDEGVVALPRAQPQGLVLLQQPLQQVPGAGGDVVPQSEGLVENVVVHFGHVPAVEGREAVHHLVGDHAQAPPVHRPAIVLLLEHLWSQVLGGTTERGGGVAWRGEGRKGEGWRRMSSQTM